MSNNEGKTLTGKYNLIGNVITLILENGISVRWEILSLCSQKPRRLGEPSPLPRKDECLVVKMNDGSIGHFTKSRHVEL
jgi:hypothetical protein